MEEERKTEERAEHREGIRLYRAWRHWHHPLPGWAPASIAEDLGAAPGTGQAKQEISVVSLSPCHDRVLSTHMLSLPMSSLGRQDNRLQHQGGPVQRDSPSLCPQSCWSKCPRGERAEGSSDGSERIPGQGSAVPGSQPCGQPTRTWSHLLTTSPRSTRLSKKVTKCHFGGWTPALPVLCLLSVATLPSLPRDPDPGQTDSALPMSGRGWHPGHRGNLSC